MDGLPCVLAYCAVAGAARRCDRLMPARIRNAAGAERDVLLPVCPSCEEVLWSEPLATLEVDR